MGFLDESLESRIMLKSDIIACDAGLNDSGSFYLYSVTPIMARRQILFSARTQGDHGETEIHYGQHYEPFLDRQIS